MAFHESARGGRSGPRQTTFLPDRLALAGKKMRSGAGQTCGAAEQQGRLAQAIAEADRYAGAELDQP